MGKRSNFARIERDFYRTPEAAVIPLLAHLKPGTRFCEPCAGDGRLIDYLTAEGHTCAAAWDIEPGRADIDKNDATQGITSDVDCFITNPPWSRPILHGIISHLAPQAPTWLLFDADWIHTKQSGPFMPLLQKVVSVGRLKWIEDSPHTGKDNCCWHLFDGQRPSGGAEFVGRMESVL